MTRKYFLIAFTNSDLVNDPILTCIILLILYMITIGSNYTVSDYDSILISINRQYIMRKHVDEYYYKDKFISFKG